METIFKNCRLIHENRVLENGFLRISGGVIREIGQGEFTAHADTRVIDLENRYLAPGFIDAHCHGGGGYDFMDGTVDAIVGAARAHMRYGTTTIAPTTLSCSDEELFAFCEHYRQACGITENMPHFLGIHLEGPFFSRAQAGAQPERYLKNPSVDYAAQVLERSGGNVIRWSMAPELPGALETAEYLKSQGVLLSIAHTDAEYSHILDAVRHGFTHMTHFYSGMSQMRRKNAFRVLGAVECGYLFDELNIEIIADGIHLPPELLRLILKCKDHSKITLVTDSMRGAGLPDGPSILGSLKDGVPVILDGGIAKLPDLTSFAGSVATTDRLVRVMVEKAGLEIPEAVAMVTENVARLYNIFDTVGSLDPGKRADLVVFDDSIRVQQVYVSGRQVA